MRFAQLPPLANDAPHVLLAMNMYWEQFVNMYALLAASLRARGVRVSVLVNDGVLPACEKCLLVNNQPGISLHETDYRAVKKIFAPLDVQLLKFSQFINTDELPTITTDNEKEHALAGALRYFAKGTLTNESSANEVLGKYQQAAAITKQVMEKVLEQDHYDVVCCHHGIYIPQGIVGEVARQHNVRVVNWNVAYREKCFIFSHGDTYHHTLLSEPTSAWENIPWTPALDKTITDYLVSRHSGSKDWISFNRAPEENTKKIIQQLGIDPQKPVIALLTNVIWDAQLHYPTNIFPNMIEWVKATIAYFATRPDLQLVIRIHPAELKGTIPSRQLMLAEIQLAFPQLPSNVFVIPPDSSISTYVIGELCNVAIIYGTKTGVELVSSGIPTIVAGEAWIKHKGLTIDPASMAEYTAALDRLPVAARLDAAIIQRAKLYAYHFFFRRMIPVSCIQPGKSIYFTVQLNNLADILPGADLGLDIICDGITTGAPFVYPDERAGDAIPTTPTGAWLDMR